MTPPALPAQRDQRAVDADHLKLLAVFHFVLAGLMIASNGLLFLHWTMMDLVFANPKIWEAQKVAPPPQAFLNIFIWFYVFMALCSLTSGALNIIAGICLQRRRACTFTLIVSGLNCMLVPFGTALGVFTLVVLMRDSVREAYQAKAATKPRTL